MQIIACAGSGKTEVITRRVIQLVKSGVLPDNILAFTFTEKAAEEMKYRIRKYLREEFQHKLSIGSMFIGTIHSFCLELLKENMPQYQIFDPLDENRTNIFLKHHYKKLKLQDLQIQKFKWENKERYKWRVISTFLKNVDIVREEGINIDDIENEEFIASFLVFNDLLEKTRKIDFSLMLTKAVDMLENNPSILSNIRNKYTYIIVDEYQDINNIQEKLINLLVGDKNNICVVGDDDQSIYQWRGAEVSNILTFKNRYKNVQTVNLKINFRGTNGIVNNANSLIINNRGRLKKVMTSQLPYEKGDIYVVNFEKQNQEIEFIIKKIKSLRGTSFIDKDKTERALDWYDFALLFRSVRKHAHPYLKAFRDANIPFIVKGSVGLFEHPEIKLIIDAMKFIFRYSNTIDLHYFQAPTQAQNLFTLLQPIEDSEKSQILLTFIKHLEHLQKDVQVKRRVNFQSLFQEIIAGILRKQYKFRNEIYYNLGQLSRIISDFEGEFYPVKTDTIRNFFDFIEHYAANVYEEYTLEERFGNANTVQIMTMHRAKGLEFPVVFIPMMDGTSFPKKGYYQSDYLISEDLFNAARYKTTEESQRRLLYVAITRSMKYLFITSATNQARISEFLRELDYNYLIPNNIPDPTMRASCSNFLPPKLSYFPTSFSELGYFFDCPKDYQIRFIFGFNPEIVEALGYGHSIHNILNLMHKKAKNQEFDPLSVLDLVEDHFHLPFASDSLLNIMKKSVYKILKQYADNYSDELKLSLETEKSFELLLENTLIAGKIDLIRKKTEKGEDLIIVDFKTEKDPDFLRQEKHAKQVILYGIALESIYGKLPRNVYVHYLDKGERKEAQFDQLRINNLKNEIKQVVDNIQHSNFPRNPKDSNRCAKCDFSKICS